MTPEISEFSYGFALTNEIVGWAPLKIAPIFPTLIEEGKQGGGYDVKLDMPGVPLYLQFKRAYRMKRSTANEVKKYKKRLNIPFHRFYITDSGTSNQHTMLLELDDGTNDVYYAAPRFDQFVEINAAWATKEVAARSIFVTPQAIGDLDDKLHHVAYDPTRTYICSEPREIEAISATQLVNKLQSRLKKEFRPPREALPELSNNVDNAIKRGQVRISHRGLAEAQGHPIAYVDLLGKLSSLPARSQVPVREAEPLSEANQRLRELADKTYEKFDLQLIIVQLANKLTAIK